MRGSRPFAITVAYLLDALWGDPPGYPHPVRLLGSCIRLLEEKMAPKDRGSEEARYAGCALAGVMIGGAWICARALTSWPGRMATEAFVIHSCLARKDLERCALRVAEAVESGDLEEARERLTSLVGRDTESLDESGICRAAVESVAENLVDAVLAPLFWAAIGGAPAALAFKAVSTLDSMVGHRDERYEKLGWASARLDDLAVFPVARLSIPIIAVSAYLQGFDGQGALRVGLRDRLCHESPNSAHSEAAFAGALGVGLGGLDHYRGRARELQNIGDGTREVRPHHIREAVRLLNMASHLGLGLAILSTIAGGFLLHRRKGRHRCGENVGPVRRWEGNRRRAKRLEG